MKICLLTLRDQQPIGRLHSHLYKCLYGLESISTLFWFEDNLINTVKPSHVVTSIKQSPVLKGHHFLVLLLKYLYELNLF